MIKKKQKHIKKEGGSFFSFLKKEGSLVLKDGKTYLFSIFFLQKRWKKEESIPTPTTLVVQLRSFIDPKPVEL